MDSRKLKKKRIESFFKIIFLYEIGIGLGETHYGRNPRLPFHRALSVFSCLQIHKFEIPMRDSSYTDDDLTGKLFNPKKYRVMNIKGIRGRVLINTLN